MKKIVKNISIVILLIQANSFYSGHLFNFNTQKNNSVISENITTSNLNLQLNNNPMTKNYSLLKKIENYLEGFKNTTSSIYNKVIKNFTIPNVGLIGASIYLSSEVVVGLHNWYSNYKKMKGIWKTVPNMPLKTKKWLNQQKTPDMPPGMPEVKLKPSLWRNPRKINLQLKSLFYPSYGYSENFEKLLRIVYNEYLDLYDKYTPEVVQITSDKINAGRFILPDSSEDRINQIKQIIIYSMEQLIRQIPDLDYTLKICNKIFINDYSWLFNPDKVAERIAREYNIYKSICSKNNKSEISYVEKQSSKTQNNAIVGYVLYKNIPLKAYKETKLTNLKAYKETEFRDLKAYKKTEFIRDYVPRIITIEQVHKQDNEIPNFTENDNFLFESKEDEISKNEPRQFTDNEMESFQKYIIESNKNIIETKSEIKNEIKGLKEELALINHIIEPVKILFKYPKKTLEFIQYMRNEKLNPISKLIEEHISKNRDSFIKRIVNIGKKVLKTISKAIFNLDADKQVNTSITEIISANLINTTADYINKYGDNDIRPSIEKKLEQLRYKLQYEGFLNIPPNKYC
jgi:hypothetical protein